MSSTPSPSTDTVDDADAVGRARLVHYLRMLVYSLTGLLGLSLLTVGTIAVIAQLKGSWHWMIHLESTVSFMAVFVAGVVAALVPTFALFVATRRWAA